MYIGYINGIIKCCLRCNELNLLGETNNKKEILNNFRIDFVYICLL